MPAIMSEPKKRFSGRKRSRTFRLPEELVELLDQLAENNFRSSNQELTLALIEHFVRAGMMPDDSTPPSDEAE